MQILAAAEAATRQMEMIDWGIMIAFFVVALAIGVIVAKKAGKSSGEFFLSGRGMPWWLLGFSMVATTFSTDTPNFVTNIVRINGVWSNWMWWCFVITGMLTVFLYAKLWRRSKVMTDVEYYELRYSGKEAAFLRGFRALYLGVIFNITVMAGVTLAAIKIGGVMLGLSPLESVTVAMLVTVIFSSMGGFKGVILTDFLLFILAMVGAFAAAYFVVYNQDMRDAGVNGVSDLFQHENVKDNISVFPTFDFSDWSTLTPAIMGLFILPLAIQWWAVWYPGAEPGGGGYLAQRMLAAKDEKHAVGATLFFQVTHYALRPWPWIIVALASLVIFPMDKKEDVAKATALIEANDKKIEAIKKSAGDDLTKDQQGEIKTIEEENGKLTVVKKGLSSLRNEFSEETVPADKLAHDLGYSAMLSKYLPVGWFGLILTSLVAAYMSTISTHLNWGSSYVVNDFWKRFIKPEASESELVWVGRISTVVMMLLTALLALSLESALEVFNIIIQIGAGTGLLFILRWFWWRINAVSEITAMVVSFVTALVIQFGGLDLLDWQKPALVVAVTTPAWIIATFLGRPADKDKLRKFVERTNPGGPGWKKVLDDAERDGVKLNVEDSPMNIGLGILNTILGCVLVYGILLGVGVVLSGNLVAGYCLIGAAGLAGLGIIATWKKATQ